MLKANRLSLILGKLFRTVTPSECPQRLAEKSQESMRMGVDAMTEQDCTCTELPMD